MTAAPAALSSTSREELRAVAITLCPLAESIDGAAETGGAAGHGKDQC